MKKCLFTILLLLFVANLSAQSDGVDAYYEKGVKLFEQKNYPKAMSLFLQSANAHNVKAMVYLGYMYENGYGVKQDKNKGIEWYSKAADRGYDIAQHNIANMYYQGNGVERNYKRALEWFKKAAEQGLPESQFYIGEMFENGYGVEKDISQAFIWYKKAAEQGLADAQFSLGCLYDIGEGVAEDKEKAVECYKKAAEQGHSQAQNNLGCMYRYGEGVQQNYSKALEWFLKAAGQKNSDSQYHLGCLYFDGQGVKKDYLKAIEWYQKAATQDNTFAQLAIGDMYRDGEGVKQDYSKAVEWYRKAAERGDAEGAICLGMMYLEGKGVTRDYNKAIEWFNTAAELGDYDGYWNIGGMYFTGEGVDRNYAKAAEWYYKGAVKEHPACQEALGTMYYWGWGVDKDFKEAIKWMSWAASQGYEKAQEKLDEWKKELPYEYFASEEKFTRPVEQKTQAPVSQQVITPIQSKTAEESTFLSDVDEEMPLSRTINRNIFAIIIGNEKYKNEVDVSYAKMDAKVFSEYVEKTLGVPHEQIKFVENATYNDIRIATNWIIQAMQVCRGKGKAIIYYAGHGIPNESDQSAYLLPVDGIGNDSASGFSLKELYEKLGNVEAQSITVFLDACFSGSKREEGMLTSARGVAIKVKPAAPTGNLIVFSAAQGDETAYPYKDKQHGMFTYFLLKKLQETKGDVSLGDLSDYLTEEVGRQSFIKNNKMQTPTVSVSSSLQNSWRSMKLK